MSLFQNFLNNLSCRFCSFLQSLL